MANATCLVNGSPPPTNTSLSASVSVALLDTAGVTSWSLQCTSTDELNTTSAIQATIVIDTVNFTASFTMPSTSTGSAVQITSIVNGESSTAFKFGVFVLGPIGNRLLFPGETNESSAQFGVVGDLNTIGRTAPGAAPVATNSTPGTIILDHDLGGTYALPDVLKVHGTSVPASPSVNDILTATSSSTADWQQSINVTGTIATSGAVTAATVTATGAVTGADFVSTDAHPATTGTIRDGNNTTIIAARNAAHNADLSVLSTDGSNIITLGSTSSTVHSVHVDGYNGVIINAGALQAANIGTFLGPSLFSIITGLGLGIGDGPISTSPYNIDSGTYPDTILLVDCSGGAISLVLPTPGISGRIFLVIDYTGSAGTHTIQVNRHAAETISGSTSKQITANYGMMLIVGVGPNWSAALFSPP